MRTSALRVIALLMVPGFASAATFTPLGSFTPTDVSATGAVVVGNSAGQAFRWTQEGGMVGLGDLPGGAVQSSASGVSDDGNVVVGSSAIANGGQEAFIWTEQDGMLPLGYLGVYVDYPTPYSAAYGISPDGGTVTGTSGTGFRIAGTSRPERRGFIWTAASGMVSIGTYGGQETAGRGVSDGGAVVVGEGVNPGCAWAIFTIPFRWTPAGGMVGLPDLFGGHGCGSATAVSADGDIVVGRAMGAYPTAPAGRWKNNTEVLNLGNFSPSGVSDDGTIVVGTQGSGTSAVAVVWSESAGLQRLIDLLAASGVPGMSGWTLSGINGISPDGHWVVGTGVDPLGQTEGFLADITLAPQIVITDSVAPINDGQVPFGPVPQGGQADQTVTVSNSGTATLALGRIALADLLAFSVQVDNCSNQSLIPNASCSITLRFSPTGLGVFSNSLDVPSNDAETPLLTISVSGTGAVVDTTPDEFTFTDVTDAALLADQISNTITISGINSPATISVSGDVSSRYSINGSAFTSSVGTVSNGNSVRVRHTSWYLPDTAVDTVLNVGGVIDTFTSTTVKYAIDDTATTSMDTPVQIDVLQNDTGFSDPVYVGIWVDPSHGTASVTGSPGLRSGIRITYTPASGFVGSDSFQYWAESGSAVDYGVVTVTVRNDDQDTDGVADAADNCTVVANPDQRDTDGDGYGNICDADLNNTGLTTAVDFNLLRNCINLPSSTSATCAAADMNGSGLVTVLDFNLLRARMNTAPGPSGLRP